MEPDGIIKGIALAEIMVQLEKENTLVKMEVAGKDFNQLTVITGVRDQEGTLFFRVDCPEELHQTLSSMDSRELIFRFTGHDKLPYLFKTEHIEFATDGVWARFPEYIERKQKRKDFRINLPLGSKIKFQNDEVTYKLPIENLSRGGALIMDARTGKASKHKPVLKNDAMLQNIKILFPRGEKEIDIHIRRAQIVRINRENNKQTFWYGILFIGLKLEEERVLTQAIYRLQRRFLRKRLPLTQ